MELQLSANATETGPAEPDATDTAAAEPGATDTVAAEPALPALPPRGRRCRRPETSPPPMWRRQPASPAAR